MQKNKNALLLYGGDLTKQVISGLVL